VNANALEIAIGQKRDDEIFIKFHHAATKNFSKHFLIVVSAVLAFSVTLSKRIIAFSEASVLQKVLLIPSWLLLSVELISCVFGPLGQEIP
jgi:hypothetical protein